MFCYVGGAILCAFLYTVANETVRSWMFGLCLGAALMWAVRTWEGRHD